MAHPVNLLIHAGIFFDESIRPRHIGFGLIIIIIRDEIFDCIIWEEAFELRIKLRGQGLIRRHNKGRALGLFNDLRHCECFTGARNAQQDLIAFDRIYTRNKFRNGFNLIALGFEFRDKAKGLTAFNFLRPHRSMRLPHRQVRIRCSDG